MKSLLASVLVLASVLSSNAEIKAVNEESGDNHIRTLKCDSAKDLFKSPLPGFISIQLMENEVNHLSLATLANVTEYNYGVYLTWQSTASGKGYSVTSIFMPTEIMSPADVLALIKSCQK